MITVLLSWIYIGCTAFCVGAGISALIEKVLGYRLKKLESIIMAGLIFATVYVQVFSLFGKVGLWANVLLCIVCVVLTVRFRVQMYKVLYEAWKSMGKGKRFLLLGLILIWAYYTSRGYMHYDTDLYHAQSIRWMEEYGVVPGLANLHMRFGYNSSSFALTALYSMKFLCGQSLHTVNGFFALLLSGLVLDLSKIRKRGSFVPADYARVAAIYYLTTLIREIQSPASDYTIMLLIFYMVIKWLDCLAEGEKEIAPYALLCVAGVYAMTLKLTAALILLLIIKPAYMLLKEKKWKDIGVYLAMGLVVAIPWFVRTVIISGWLIYPFPAIDLFDVDWKVPKWLAEVDAADIYLFGRGLQFAEVQNVSAVQWLPDWFITQLGGTEKVLILGCLLSLVLLTAEALWMILKRRWDVLDHALVLGTITGCYLLWQLTAPLIRYGYAYVLLLSFLAAGTVIHRMKLQKVVYYCLILYGVYKVAALMPYTMDTLHMEYYVRQQDYDDYIMDEYEVNGETFYYPIEGDRAGYIYFPSTFGKVDFEFRGKTMKDGFRIKE